MKQETLCLLCKSNPANQTGSHIIPFFILRMIDNEEGSSKRGKELGFIIGSIFDKSYFGQSILPEKLEEVYGGLSDEEIENLSKSPWIADYIFCSGCEKRLSVIESEYAKSLGKFEANKIYSSTSGVVSFLLWASLIWRVSVTKRTGFRLKPKFESRLRRLLDKYLVNDLSGINNELIGETFVLEITYKILRCPEYSKPMIGIFHPNHFQPYCFIVGEFVLFFYFKNAYHSQVKSLFFGFEEAAENAVLNTLDDDEMVFPLEEDFFSDCIHQIMKLKTGERYRKYGKVLDAMHRKLGKSGKMSNTLKNEIYTEMALHEETLGRKYTMDDFAKTTYDVLSRYMEPNQWSK